VSKSRTIELRYELVIPEPKDRGDPIRAWLPVPVSTHEQEVLALESLSSVPVSLGFDTDFGNGILHAVSAGDGVQPVRIGYRAIVRRSEWRVALDKPPAVTFEQDLGLLSRQLAQTRKVRFLPDIVKVATEIRSRSGNAIDTARAAYEHVLATMTYDKSGDGWGAGDTEWACSTGRGNCTDFHTLFMAILRCAGVACEFEIGAAFPADMSGGDITHFKCGYHCWTRFFAPGIGWVPADVSEASRNPDKRDYFFGAIDEDRVMLSRGRDIEMFPGSNGGPENFFTEPRLERSSGSSVIYEKKLEFASL
jgi:transglutaminase-like putative cysteine protease